MYKGNDDDTFTLLEIPMRLVIAVGIVCVFIRGTNEVELTEIYSTMDWLQWTQVLFSLKFGVA